MSKISSYRILLYSLCLPVILIIAGCADDLRNRSLFDCGAGDAVISYSIADVILTRDDEELDFESVVDHAYLLFYSSDASVNSAKPIAAVRAESDLTNPGCLKFKMPIDLTPNTDYKLLAVANADSYTQSGFENYGVYLQSRLNNHSSREFSPLLLFSESQINPENTQLLPMSGDSQFRFSMEDGAYHISTSLSFRRKVARIDVFNNVKEDFKVEGILLCNYRDATEIYPSEDGVGNTLGSLHRVLSEESISDDQFITMPDANEAGCQKLSKKIYCFPSVSYKSFLGDKESTALIIKAKYGQDSESSYYRVNVGVNGNKSMVKANTKYLITIQSVKGTGATTSIEAYSAKESPIVLSVVEDWDLEGEAYDMDDKGNFIVLSKGRLEFEGNATESIEVRVLTSNGLQWNAEYIAADEASKDAFDVEKRPESSIRISPKGLNNEGDQALTGFCKVSATTTAGTELCVNISLCQNVADETFKEPEIPADMPFAIVPESYDRVKINHIEKTIEIDGFDPNCFNSFLDIPFKVKVIDEENSYQSFKVSSNLEWPLEGRISTTSSADYYYGQESFATLGKGKVYTQVGNYVDYSALYKAVISVDNISSFFISVGAMGPDDPAIVRTITISSNAQEFPYKLIIKPRPAIIDDVILYDASSQSYWMIQDRNIQAVENAKYADENCNKYQAYNYSFCFNLAITIPFKFSKENTVMNETYHSAQEGVTLTFGSSSQLVFTPTKEGLRFSWLKMIMAKNIINVSPFYMDINYDHWIIPNRSLIEIMRSKLRVSKLRMYLVSDVSGRNGKYEIPVCCYLPYNAYDIGDTDPGSNTGYFSAEDGNRPDLISIFYFDKNSIKTSGDKKNGSAYTRLVRQFKDNDELEDYKNNYLGYDGKSLKLPLCHPDTYTSDGWIGY